MIYYQLPHCHVARNYKVATLSLGKAICDRYYRMTDTGWHAAVPQTDTPDTPVLLLVREPVERFRSAAGMLQRPVDELLDGLDDVHLVRQVEFTRSGQPTTTFRFPNGIEALCRAADVGFPLPHINAACRPKPDLTDAQRSRILEIYAEDVALFEGAR